MNIPKWILLICVVTVGLAAPLRAETIPLTAVSGYSPVTSWVHMFKTYFMPEVDRRLLAAGGEHDIAWIEGFSGTVVKPRGEFEAIESGIGDIGIVVTAFHVDKVPLYNIAFVTPFVSHDLLLVVRTVDALTEKFPEMRAGWEKYNQVYLAATGTVDTYQVVTSEPVRSLADFQGMKIGGELFELPAAERAKWAAALPDIAGNWADDMAAQGLSGHAILADYMQTMRDNDQPIARHWDR